MSPMEKTPLHTFAISLIITAMLLGHSACNKKNVAGISSDAPVIDTLVVSVKPDNAGCLSFNAGNTEFLVLQEDDDIMFAEPNQIIDAYGKYVIVDSYGSRRVVSFDHDGKPYASYGKRGNGPGEYMFPNYVDVDSGFVYILDSSQRKLHKYAHDGKFIDSKSVPFRCNGFALLNDNALLFNLAPSDQVPSYQLCITDSLLNPTGYLVKYPDGYFDSYGTNNIFRKSGKVISYYSSPADTIYQLDYGGNLIGKRVLDFKGNSIDGQAKLNLMDSMENGLLTHGLHVWDSPIETPSGYCFMSVTDYSTDDGYVIAAKPNENPCYMSEFGEGMSIYGVNAPYSMSYDGRIISYLDLEMAHQCDDFINMPERIVQELKKGNRILVLHRIIAQS